MLVLELQKYPQCCQRVPSQGTSVGVPKWRRRFDVERNVCDTATATVDGALVHL
jgi:hypothetical protein